MDLKNALTVCLISLFSATLVLLIARVLDLQAANRLEPQLVRIVDELEAIRKQGGLVAGSVAGQSQQKVADGLVVYYLHSNIRCVTCRSIEAQTHEVVQSEFAAESASGEIRWEVLNYEEPSAADLAKKFEIQMPVVVLARMEHGEIADWKSLDRVWALVGDKPAFAAFVGDEIRQMLGAAQPASAPTPVDNNAEIPAADLAPADIPVPVPEDLPIPE